MQILEGLLKLPENRECADCKAKYVISYGAAEFGYKICKMAVIAAL